MFRRRRCHGYKVKKTPKEDRVEAEGQFDMENESDDSSEEKESEHFGSFEGKESVVSSEETQMRGKTLDWQHVECFDSPQAFNKSQIKVELDEVMTKSNSFRTSEARQESYVCKFFKKRAWKSCLFQYRVKSSLSMSLTSPGL